MIVKAEILWTRQCPLRCHYCNMVDGRQNTPTIDFWKVGLDNLKALNCKFIAIYGAEPLADFHKLPEFISYACQLGIDLTLITSGVDRKVKEKLKILYTSGLRSLTCSYDIVDLSASSRTKTQKSLPLIEYFRGLGPVDNVAIVVTLTRTNYKYLYTVMEEMTSKNIWTFFDIIHPDRGQPGSKVKGADESLLFKDEDLSEFLKQFKKIKENKHQLMIHASDLFFDYLLDNPRSIITYDWNCADYKVFPSWVTVDCDGLVYPCDDYQPQVTDIYLDELVKRWEEFLEFWRKDVKQNCPGCLWNTHLDAHYIKQGLVNILEYVHK